MSGRWPDPLTVEQIYGDWDYDGSIVALERSRSPRSLDSLLDTVDSLGIGPGGMVVDVGGRDGRHAFTLAERQGCRVVSVDPVQANQDRMGRQPGGPAQDLVELRRGTIEAIPVPDGFAQLVFARDMLFHVEDLDVALVECRRVLAPNGAMLIYELLASSTLSPEEERLLCADAAVPPPWKTAPQLEASAQAAGFTVERCEIIGSEHVEALLERGGSTNYLLQFSRLRRAREELLDEIGEVAYRVHYANALWTIYQVLGKLESRVYVLRR